MPRPRSADKRAAILTAATQVVAAEGLTAATALIARRAGVSNGSLFTYFATKADLLDQLYLELKTDMAAAACAGLSRGAAREQLLQVWTGWLGWAARCPEKRRALAQLEVSDQISASTHRIAGETMAEVAMVVERSRAEGPMRDRSVAFVLAMANAIAEATIDFVVHHPEDAEAHGRAGFDALWRMLS